MQDEPRRSKGVLGPSLAENRPKTDPTIENRESAECRCVHSRCSLQVLSPGGGKAEASAGRSGDAAPPDGAKRMEISGPMRFAILPFFVFCFVCFVFFVLFRPPPPPAWSFLGNANSNRIESTFKMMLGHMYIYICVLGDTMTVTTESACLLRGSNQLFRRRHPEFGGIRLLMQPRRATPASALLRNFCSISAICFT